MARTDNLTNFLTDVAAAIKSKKGDNTAIPAANFDTEIINLPSGGSDNTALISLIERTATSFEIPEGTTSIGGSAFSRCTGLTSIIIPNSVTSIGDDAFEQCFSLTSITIPNSVTSIGGSAFNWCIGLTSIMIPDSITNISNYAFYHCTGLTSITIPGSVTSIGESAFYDCTGLTKINWNAENVSDFTSNSGIFYNAGTAGNGIDVVFNNNVKRIPAYIFYISDTNKRPKITSVTIGNSVTSIGNTAFKSCTGLTKINWNAENVSDFTNTSKVFYDAGTARSGIDIVFGNSVKSIPAYAFDGCSSLTSATIGNNVTSIGNSAFKDCTGLTKINWNAENINNFTSNSEVFYNAGTDERGIDIVFGDNVKRIPAYIFYISDTNKRPKITSVTIGNSVTSIDNSTFKDCIGLTSITIPNSVTSIGNTAFEDCTDLTSVTIGNSVREIYTGAFSGCTGLTKINWNAENVNDFTSNSKVFYNAGTAGNGIDVVFGDNVKRIPAYVFYVSDSSSRPKIKSITIGNSVTSIGNTAFNDCTDLISVTIGNSVTNIGSGAFYSCRGLTSITIPNSVTSIGDSAFGDCTSLTSVTIPNSVTSIGDYAFSSCIGLTSVTIGNSVTNIGSGAFYSCRGLTSITIPNSVTSIGNSAFSSCTGLTEIDFSTHTTVPTLGAINAFDNTSANLAIKVPSTLLDEWKAATNWSTYADKIMGV